MEADNMQKLLSLLLVPLLLLSMVTPALGSGYRETAEAYLDEKYGGKGATIEMYEGGIMELEFTGESFWYAKYTIIPAGEPTTTVPGEKPMPNVGGTKPAVLPPDAIGKPEPSIEPAIMPRLDIYYDNYIYGGIYIHVKTGDILEMDEMEPYFLAEYTLADQEWERLSKEAGKLDVSLYRKLLELKATDIVKVSIQPTLVVTAEMTKQFEALKVKYPKIFAEMNISLENFLGITSGAAIQGGTIVATDGGKGSTGSSTPDAGGSSPAKDTILIDPARPTDKPGEVPQHDEKYWQEYNAFWTDMEQLRVAAMAESLSSIGNALNDMGAAYADNNYYIGAELTSEQIRAIAEHSAVASIYEEFEYHTMDNTLALRSNLAIGEKTAAPSIAEDGDDATQSNYLPMILGVMAIFGGVIVVVKRRVI
jgi:hypothetical protein